MDDEGPIFPRMRLDSEYVWEGEEMMYEDIVASTQPANYNQMTRRKHPDNYFSLNFFENLNEEVELAQQIEFTQPAWIATCGGSGRGGVCGIDECQDQQEEFGLDSTIISANMGVGDNIANQSMVGQMNTPLPDHFNFDWQDQDQSLYFGSQIALERSAAFENLFQIQTCGSEDKAEELLHELFLPSEEMKIDFNMPEPFVYNPEEELQDI